MKIATILKIEPVLLKYGGFNLAVILFVIANAVASFHPWIMWCAGFLSGIAAVLSIVGTFAAHDLRMRALENLKQGKAVLVRDWLTRRYSIAYASEKGYVGANSHCDNPDSALKMAEKRVGWLCMYTEVSNALISF